MFKDEEDYEFYEEWIERDGEFINMSLEEYNNMRYKEEYGTTGEKFEKRNDD